jgi:hypothetical protein
MLFADELLSQRTALFSISVSVSEVSSKPGVSTKTTRRASSPGGVKIMGSILEVDGLSPWPTAATSCPAAALMNCDKVQTVTTLLWKEVLRCSSRHQLGPLYWMSKSVMILDKCKDTNRIMMSLPFVFETRLEM